jgi:hypothetical protein
MSKRDDSLIIETNKIFIEEEIKKISNIELQAFLREAVKDFPDYFWISPASLEKYHYPDERKKGGLVLHVRRVCKLVDVFVNMQELNLWERDVLLTAGILHDSFARGIPPMTKGYSDQFHPLYPTERFPYNGYADRFIKDKKIYDEIMECVVSHSGRYSVHTILHSKKKLATFFQMVDYIASRDFIMVEV